MGTMAIIGLVAAVVGTAMQQYASYQANKAAQAQLNAGMQQLQSSQDKINKTILANTQEYSTENREQRQAEEQQRIADDIKSDVSESQAIRDATQETAGNVSDDYSQARAQAQAETAAQANAFADLIGQIRSAGTLRQNESYKNARYGQQVGMLARNAQGDWTVAQAKANDALHSKDGLANMGKLVSTVGSLMSIAGAGAGTAATNAGTAATGASSAAATGATASNALGSSALNLGAKAALAGGTAALLTKRGRNALKKSAQPWKLAKGG